MRLLLSIIASVLALIAASTGQNCAIWNTTALGSGTSTDYFGYNYHITGNHTMHAGHAGSCYYSNNGTIGSTCATLISVGDSPSGSDTGLVSGLTHVGKFAQVGAYIDGVEARIPK